ncbi:MAG: DinB family protein, partial [Giesbergeria sp.]
MRTVIQAGTYSRAAAPGAVRSEGRRIRSADAVQLAAALTEGRALLLAMFAGFEEALGPRGLAIDFDTSLNLPLWELGHIGWFEEWWILRNTSRAKGTGCSSAALRSASLLNGADALYDSSNVPHSSRWALALPDAAATRAYLAQVREATLALLPAADASDNALYFFHLALLHEDMHREAWFMMAQHLGIDLGEPLPGMANTAAPLSGEWLVPAGVRPIGGAPTGFNFDNELLAHSPFVEAFSIDRSAVCWSSYLPFAESGGYHDERLWTTEGWRWRQQHSNGLPL